MYFKHFHVICRENLTFSGQQVKYRNIFHLGNNSTETQSEGTGHRGSCCYGVTLTRSRCARCATCQVWYPLSTQGCLWKTEGRLSSHPGSQYGTAQ